MASRIKIAFLFFGLFIIALSCTKNTEPNTGVVPPPPPPATKLSYGDSIFYLQNQVSDYIITSNQTAVGRYTSFPDGLEMNENTGAVNVSKSESGLRYRISFKPNSSTDSISTIILISGVNFLDGFYKLTSADSIAKPVYNGNKINTIPGINNGSSFDEGSNCNSAGCTVNLSSGTINLAQTVRNGVFGSKPSNNDRHEFVMNYRINDKSNKSLNTLKVKLYYFDSINDVTQEVYDIISSREGTLLRGVSNTQLGTTLAGNGLNKPVGRPQKPRPPCIFILAN